MDIEVEDHRMECGLHMKVHIGKIQVRILNLAPLNAGHKCISEPFHNVGNCEAKPCLRYKST